jgi:Icc-related predicted phosphoesterase
MIKIRAFSDWHGHDFLRRIYKDEDCDIVLLCGDAGIHESNTHRPWGYGKAIKSKFPKATIVMVPGNHDHLQPQETFEGIDHVLINSEVTVKGLRIYGCPYWESENPDMLNPLCREYLVSNQEAIKACMSLIPRDLDILITHTPPRHILDGIYEKRFGSPALYNKLWKLDAEGQAPRFHFFGHVHAMGGTQTKLPSMDTIFFNVALLDENYNMTNPVHGGLYI